MGDACCLPTLGLHHFSFKHLGLSAVEEDNYRNVRVQHTKFVMLIYIYITTTASISLLVDLSPRVSLAQYSVFQSCYQCFGNDAGISTSVLLKSNLTLFPF